MTKGRVAVGLLLIFMVGTTLNFVMLSWGIGILMRTILLTPVGVVAGFQLGRMRRAYLRGQP